MKHTKHILLMAAMLLGCFSVSAEVVQIDGIWYDIVKKAAQAEVVGGPDSGDIVIPSVVEYEGVECSVTSIGEYAFRGYVDIYTGILMHSISSVSIPESVTSIGGNAFIQAIDLSAVYITSIEAWCKISFDDNPLTYADNLYLNGELVTELVIPEGVTSIGAHAFENCSSLTSITLPEGVTSIGESAFSRCSSLTSVTIPESVTSIGGSAFSGCSSLTSVIIAEGVTSIGAHAFSGCSSLTSITIPASVTSIGSYAFRSCSSLTSITIPEGVTSIGYEAFMYCSSLTSITIPASVTSIGDEAFSGCSSLTSITIPASVTSIGDEAFKSCSSLSSIFISENSQLTEISNVFSNCNGLTSITIPESVTEIGASAFRNCSSLVSITIPESVTSIGRNAFENCSSLISITIPEGVTSIGLFAFSGCTDLASVVLPKSLNEIHGRAFTYCEKLLDVYCYAKQVPLTDGYAFENSYPEYITLHVPLKSLNDYKATAPWSSFGKFETIETPVSSITLSETSLTLTVGDVWQLSVTEILPEDATDKSIVWSSSNPNIATVDEEGRVQAIAPGSATITATANDGSGVSASCGVTIVEDTRYSLTFMVDGEIIQTETSETPIEVVFPEAPEKEGHNFLSWRMDVNDDEITEIDIANNADAMLYSNAPCTNTQYGDQFTSWDVLFDDDYNTFFHSEYSEGVDSEDGEHHYLRVDMGEGNSISKFTFSYAMRGDQFPFHTPTEIVVEGSNDADGVYEEIAVLTDLAAPPYEISYTSEILGNGKAYRYIRYRVTRTRQNSLICGHPYFYISEFGMKNADNLRKMVYRAYYECNAYNVYYYVGEELVNTVRVFYGDNIPEYTYEPTDNNEEFLGWEGDTYSTMPAHDITYRAIINSDETGDSDTGYSLTFMVDGEVFQTETSETPIELVFPEAPEKEGYSFVRWELGSSDAALTDIDIANNADEMLYTNAPCTNTKYGDQFTSWDVLFDDDNNTFFHSEYSEGVDSEDGEHHYLRVDMGEGNAVSQFTFSYAMRGGQSPNHTPTEIIVEGSNEAFGEYEVIAVLTDLVLPPTPTSIPPYKKDYTSEILGNGKAYRYIRYRVTETYYNDLVCGHPYFYISEFGMKKAQDCYNAVYHGVYAPNKYKVYYYVGEELLDYVEVTYGDQMPNMGYFPALDTEEFLGWVSETGDTYETMPAHDVTYVANIRTYEKCATPTIRYADGRVTFSCETEGVEFTTQVRDDKRPIYRTDSEGFEFVPTYTFTTRATKEGCMDSDDVSVTICWIDCTGEHEVGDDETDIISVPSQPVIIQCANGVITLTGLADGTAVAVYDTAGMELGTAEVVNGVATIATNLTAGSTAIVTMGNRSVKVVIK